MNEYASFMIWTDWMSLAVTFTYFPGSKFAIFMTLRKKYGQYFFNGKKKL